MPLRNEHTARQTDPNKYNYFRRSRPKGFPLGIDVIYGIKTNNKTEIQSIRFDSKLWTVDKAKEWLKEHNFKIEYFEPVRKTVIKALSEESFWKDIV